MPDILPRFPSKNPRTKNIRPNFNQKLFKRVRQRYRQIKYRTHTKKKLQANSQIKVNQLKITQILLVCLIARTILGQRLQSFKNMISHLIQDSINKHKKKMNQEYAEFRKKAIRMLKELELCCMKVINDGESCLSQCLDLLFKSEQAETGRGGRQNIQRNKLQRSLDYIQQQMAQLGQSEINSEIQEMENTYSEDQAQGNQQNNQVSSDSIAKESEETQMSISEIEQIFISQDELMGYLYGENLIDFVLKSPQDPQYQTFLRMCDLLERKQEEEIKYMLLCKRTTTKLWPANKQA